MNSVMAGEKAKDDEFEIIAKMARKQWLKNHDYLLSDEEIDRAIERVRNERKSERRQPEYQKIDHFGDF